MRIAVGLDLPDDEPIVGANPGRLPGQRSGKVGEGEPNAAGSYVEPIETTGYAAVLALFFGRRWIDKEPSLGIRRVSGAIPAAAVVVDSGGAGGRVVREPRDGRQESLDEPEWIEN